MIPGIDRSLRYRREHVFGRRLVGSEDIFGILSRHLIGLDNPGEIEFVPKKRRADNGKAETGMTIRVHQGIELQHRSERSDNEQKQPSGPDYRQADEG